MKGKLLCQILLGLSLMFVSSCDTWETPLEISTGVQVDASHDVRRDHADTGTSISEMPVERIECEGFDWTDASDTGLETTSWALRSESVVGVRPPNRGGGTLFAWAHFDETDPYSLYVVAGNMGVIGTSLSRTVSNTKLDGDRPNERVLALFFIDPGKLTLATTHRFVQCEYEPASDLKCQYDVENLQQGLDQIYPFDQFDLKFTRDATAELPNSVVMIAKSTNMQSGYTLLNFDSEATNLLFDLVPGEIGRAGLSDKRHFFPHLFYNSGATGSPVFGVVDEKIHPAIYRRNAGDGTKYVRADLNSDWVMTDDLIVADQTFDFVVNDIDGMKHFGYVGILRTGSSDGGENASGRLVFVPEEGGVAARRVLSDIKDVSLVKTFGVPGGPSLILFRYGDDGGHLGIGQWTHLDDPALFKFKYLAFEVGVMSDLSGFSMNAGLHAIPNTANSIGFFARKNDKPGLGRLMPDDPNDLATWCAF